MLLVVLQIQSTRHINGLNQHHMTSSICVARSKYSKKANRDSDNGQGQPPRKHDSATGKKQFISQNLGGRKITTYVTDSCASNKVQMFKHSTHGYHHCYYYDYHHCYCYHYHHDHYYDYYYMPSLDFLD